MLPSRSALPRFTYDIHSIMGRKFLFFLVAVLFAVGAVFFIVQKQNKEPSSDLPRATVRIGNISYAVEVAETPVSQAQGLSGRASLKEGSGMLFTFPERSPQTFWMKGMRFPLDFVWIAEGIVVGITENAPADDGLLTYGSPEPVDMVLEVNAGEINRLGIKAGDLVTVALDADPAQ